MKFSNARIFLLLCLSFLGGIGLSSLIKVPPLWLGGVLILGIALVAVFWSNKKTVVAGFCLLTLATALWRQDFLSRPENLSSATPVSVYNDLPQTTVTGIIDNEPRVGLAGVKYEVRASEIELPDAGRKKVDGKILVSAPKYPSLRYGDKVEITGTLKTPPKFEDFNYRAFLAKDNIFSVITYPKKFVLVSSGNGHAQRGNGQPFYRFLFSFKEKMERVIASFLPEPHSSFLSALLIGSRSTIPPDLMEAFQETGTTHIIAISGYNITIIAVAVAAVFGFFTFSRRVIFWLTLLVIFLFTLLTGAEASVVRAAIMGSLVVLASKEGRGYQVTNAVIFAAAVMLWFNPKLLRWDAGFQLSFLATLGLIYLQPILVKFFPVREIKGKSVSFLRRVFLTLKEIFLTTMSAQVAVLPMLIYHFDRISLISPLANILILPAIPFTMFFGFVSVALGFIFLPLAKVIGYVTWLFLSYEIWIAEVLARVPYGSLEVLNFSFVFVLLCYGVLIGLYVWLKKKADQKIGS